MKNNGSTHEMEMIYRDIPEDQIPWNMEQLPSVLNDVINSDRIQPCKTIDLGCGTGNYALEFARRGFDITGVDISGTAIRMATEKATKAKLNCSFMVGDVLKTLNLPEESFDFAYDWEMLHHIFPEHRSDYVQNVYNILKPHGHYLSCSFSESDPHFGGEGKYRKTPLNTVLYFSSEQELRELFSLNFNICEFKTMQIEGKMAPHSAVFSLMTKR